MRWCARRLSVPFSEVDVSRLDGPYHVPRALEALLDAPLAAGPEGAWAGHGWGERVMQTPLREPV